MSIRIGSKLPFSQTSIRKTSDSSENMQKTLEKLSSGKKINRAGDDAAGLAIAQKMGEALKALEQGMENAYDGLSMIQTADGALDQTSANLGRMRELAMTAANGTLNEEQRAAVETEFNALKEEVDRISGSTQFNDQQLLDGSAGTVDIALADGSGGADTLGVDLSTSMDAASLGVGSSSVGGADGSNALSALRDIDAAMSRVSEKRSELGATANRLESASRNMAVAAENTYASQSRIQDADFAVQTANLAREQMLAQSGVAVQAQSKGLAATALNLLK
jgi:flagellin